MRLDEAHELAEINPLESTVQIVRNNDKNCMVARIEVTARVPPCWCRAHGHAKFENTAREHVLLACFRKL